MMTRVGWAAVLWLTMGVGAVRAVGPAAGGDMRNIRHGLPIPAKNYCDQPYIVITPDGNWLCTLTTGKGEEGQPGQHVVSTISTDQGRTWSPLVDIEPPDGPEASWAVPLLTPGGRVYVFYDYNGDRLAPQEVGGRMVYRFDMLGWYCYRYSDDFGRSWSAERYRLPVRVTACDRNNDWEGKVQIFWGIDKPKIHDGVVMFGFSKLGRYMLDDGEGWFFRSDNILTEPDVSKIRWEMLPEGDHGVRDAAFGSVQEEHNLVFLHNGDVYCIYRTTMGFPCHAYSRDGGRSWTRPEAATYTPGGRTIKNPRANAKIWKTQSGRFLLWYHNHGGTDFRFRNPAWLAGGIEKDGHIHWSQPEILLYDPNPDIRMSYPDLIEQDGRYWISETQKEIARVHELDPELLEGLWNQGRERTVTTKGQVLALQGPDKLPAQANLPRLPDLVEGQGVTLDLWLTLESLAEGQTVLDARDASGRGLALTTTAQGTLRLDLADSGTKSHWDCDPGLLRAGQRHHIGVVIDAGPRIITFIVDGQVCDGGTVRQYGWGRFPSELVSVNGSSAMTIAPSVRGRLESLRVYNRALRNSEVIAHYQAGVR